MESLHRAASDRPQNHARDLIASATKGLSSGMDRRATFVASEDGNMTIYALGLFMSVITITGVGVDLMLNEMHRTKLQGTLDRAILAAADLDQSRDPDTVVEDYFDAAGLSHALLNVDTDRTANQSTVTATALLESDPLFIGLLGVDNMSAPAFGQAEERIGNVEVSLVLDVSGSMGWASAEPGSSKLDVMKEAADDFLALVLDPENGGVTTVNVVPYNNTVNLGPTLASYYNLDDNHSHAHCVRFEDSAFESLGISSTQTLDRLSHFDLWTYNWNTSPISSPICPTGSTSEIKVHQTDESSLSSFINSLDAGGNTAIDLGMKWGMALLDNGTSTVVNEMIDDQHVPAVAEDRPATWDDHESMKIVVLMTDGENTTQYDLHQDMQTGMSGVWVDDRGTATYSDDRFSTLVDDYAGTSNDVFFYDRYRNSSWSWRYQTGPDGGSNAREMSMEELFSRFDVYTNEIRFHRTPYYDGKLSWNEFYKWYRRYDSIVSSSQADARLATLCDAAREQSVYVYTVAFEAPSNGIAAMQQCASSDSHFFDVDGTELSDAFEVIASTINQLRLTQ